MDLCIFLRLRVCLGLTHACVLLFTLGCIANSRADTAVSEKTYVEVLANGRADELSSLLTDGDNPNAILTGQFGHKTDALTLAVRGGSIRCVELLLQHGAAVNGNLKTKPEEDRAEWHTPLTAAVEDGAIPIVQLLVQYGADVNRLDYSATVPLTYAIHGHFSIAKYLIHHGADVNYQCKGSFTPLMDCAYQNNLDGIKFLVERGAKLDLTDSRGDSALILAANFQTEDGPTCNPGAIRLLVECGANVNVRNQQGRSALMFVADSSGADGGYGNLGDEDKLTKCARLLLSHQANTNYMQTDGSTALKLARENHHLGIVQLLRKRKLSS
jgi:ankyrin repeat protein